MPNEVFGTTASLQWHAWDQTSGTAGNSVDITTNGGTTAFSTDSVVSTLNVSDINDATVITPSTLSISIAEDSELVFGTGEAQSISLSDVDTLSTVDYKLRLGVIHGKLTLGSLDNITIIDGQDNSASVQIQGKFSDIQNALEGLKYTPDAHYFSSFYGPEKIVIEVIDIGDTGTLSMISTKEIDITVTSVNDIPSLVDDSTDNSVLEDIDASSQDISLNGTFTYDDADLESGDNVDITSSYNNDIVWSGGDIDTELANKIINGFVFDPLINETTSGNGSWTLNVSSVDLDFLSNGETISLSYKLVVTDELGAQDTFNLIITITGTNDQPEVSDVTVEDTLTETNGNETIYNGQLELTTDVDTTDTHTFQIVENTVNITSNNGADINSIGLKVAVNEDGSYKVDGNFDALAQGEIATITFQYTGTDDSATDNAVSAEKRVTLTVTGSNDQPIIDNTATLGLELGFGEKLEPQNLKEIFKINDIDTTDKLEFTIINAPKGVVIDPKTGILSGSPTQSGNFSITVRVSDPQGTYVEKTFDMLVIAPPQAPAEPTTSTNDVNEVAQQIKLDIELNTSTEIVEVEQTVERSGLGLGDNNGVQLGEINDQQQNVDNTELTSLTNNNNNNPNDRIISAGVDLAVNTDGQITFNEETQKSFETVGMAIETLDFNTENLEVKIVDSRVGQKYTVTLADDTPLPNTLRFDPNTGLIDGKIPKDIEVLELKVSARSTDGTTRELTIKLDVKAMKEAQNQNNNEAKFETLSEQINAQNYKMNDYGSFVTSLFSA